ncbi:hypoxanthine-guanine phosphoribosyltransferases [Metamycoplasma arthritidis]|uniref:Hypoxanthine phosphoribosyltransferase n=2 Tax=Metamycoplasma arthritidis TaxID=2111 RepID=B3PMJ4_META1|nr:hypoxanthine-guanine phosphoribosyltransferase [Metamycoplasma arthritidis 158L3-1]VEU78770.1 hypoxanthine-guanine phosphoribosyltransferases [Metamycoplasma arthritidis]
MLDKRIEKVLFDQKTLEKRILELSMWVNENYSDQDELIIIGLLKGSLPFLAQLIKNINVDFIMDFMTVSSYDGKAHSSGSVKVILDLANDIKDRHVLIVEDIIDSGRTMQKVVNLLNSRNPQSLRVLTLLNKPSGRKVKFEPDKFGFMIGDEFVVGFGFDWHEKMRQLPYIGILKECEINKEK